MFLLVLTLLVPTLSANHFANLPRYFEPDLPQPNSGQRFISRGTGYTLLVTERDVVVTLGGHAARMTLMGARAATRVETLQQQPGVSHYLVGSDPDLWRRNVPHYGRLQLAEVYPGIDLVFYGNQRAVEYDFVVAPGARPQQIRMLWQGAGQPRMDPSGNLSLETPGGTLRLERPHAWQQIRGERRKVAARFSLARDGTVGFSLGRWDARYPLVIDPVLSYSGLLPGTAGFDTASAIAVDPEGNAYVCGWTGGTGLATAGVAQPAYGGGTSDAFVAKINASGTTLLYLTYLGGADSDSADSIAVDEDGNAYVGGQTSSTNFPLRMPLQSTLKGAADGFAAKLSSEGAVLLYSTYLGGTGTDQVNAVAVDASGALYLAGQTTSTDFPVTAGAFRTLAAGQTDAWAAKIHPLGMVLVYSTLLGGSDFDYATAIALDGAGNAYVTGSTYSTNFPVTPGAFVTANATGAQKGFVSKLNPAGSGVVFSTYFCGTSDNFASIAVDEAGHSYITGWTPTGDIPITAGSYRTTASGVDAFVAKLNSAGTGLIFSTYLGGTSAEFGGAVRVNPAGNAYVIGNTTSTNFPTTGSPYQGSKPTTVPTNITGYLSVFNPIGAALVYSTYFGGSTSDVVNALALDAAGNAYLAGAANSTDFPKTPQNSFGVVWKGSSDGFAAKFSGFNLTACQGAPVAASTSYPVAGGSGTIPVQAADGCNWHAMASLPFVSLTGGTPGGVLGSGAGNVPYVAAPSTASLPRTASISAAGNIIQIIQSGTASTSPFDDVPVDHSFLNHLALMKSNSITSGCTATSYCPEGTTTRGQMSVFIMRSMLGGDNFPFPSTPYFADVPASHPYFKWVQKMKELGITAGCTTTTYCPDEPVTRGQMSVFIIRSLAGNNFKYASTPYFTDVPSNHQFFSFIQKMKEWGITAGCTTSTYCPDSPTTRGQMGVFIIRGFFSPR